MEEIILDIEEIKDAMFSASSACLREEDMGLLIIDPFALEFYGNLKF